MASPDIPCSIVNPAIPSGQDLAVIYQGVSATLNITLTNNTGGAISFQAGSSASSFEIFLPSKFFTSTQIGSMTIQPPANWTWKPNSADNSLMLIYQGPGGATWASGTTLVFAIQQVLSTAAPSTSSLQLNPANMTGNLPIQIPGTFSLSLPPDPKNPDLSTALQVSLDMQGSVYISPSNDPLPNTLFLTLKNVNNGGASPLYTGKNMWQGDPTIIVSFVYGLTAGALAPDNDKTALGSAWKIAGGIATSEGNAWQVTNPNTSGQDPHPLWTLKPTRTNQTILGTQDSANITFSFANIISFTPPGHTQMFVQFTGFPATDTTNYNDAVLVLDIVKQAAPATRGLFNFYGPSALATVASPTDVVTIKVNWGMFYVDRVTLIPSIPGISPINVSYPNVQALAYDNATISVTNITVSTPVFLTLQAFDSNRNYLNAMQYTVFINALEFVDPRDGKVYSAVQVGNTLWMAQNLDYADPSSIFYNDSQSYEVPYGRLYPPSAAAAPSNSGWRLPTQADWQKLIAAMGSNPYAALIAGGSSGFNAQLGGYSSGDSNFGGIASTGYYWTATGSGGQTTYAQFSASSSGVYVASQFPANYLASVRYIKDVTS